MSGDANNFHYLDGIGMQYWGAIARGYRPQEVRTGPMGASIVFARDDIDGFVTQNGGMSVHSPTKIRPGRYFRFIGTIAHNIHGANSFAGGGWWIEYEDYVKVTDWAEKLDLSLARAAAQLLIIPKEWGDCGYVGRATLTTPMKAFVGTGKPATGSVSPDAAGRRAAGAQVQIGVPHVGIKQIFVPGTRALLSQVFQPEGIEQVIHKGQPFPFLSG